MSSFIPDDDKLSVTVASLVGAGDDRSSQRHQRHRAPPLLSPLAQRYTKILVVFVWFGIALLVLDSTVLSHTSTVHMDYVRAASSLALNASDDPVAATTTMAPPPPTTTTAPPPTTPPGPTPIPATPAEPKAAAPPQDTEVFTPKKLRFLTLADNPHGGICLLASTLFQDGHVLEVLAWNHSSTFFDKTTCGDACLPNKEGNNRRGQQKKLHWIQHFVEHSPDLDDDDLLLFTDAWDVVVQDSTNRLPELFLRHTANRRGIIFNGEPTCGDSFVIEGLYGNQLRTKNWQIQLEVGQEPRGVSGKYMCDAIAAKTGSNTIIPGPNWSLGSGGILGDVRSVRAFLRRVAEVRAAQELEFQTSHTFLYEGDQILFQIAYLKYPEINVKVDAAAEIFFVLSYLVGPRDFTEFDGIVSVGCTPYFNHEGKPSQFKWNGVSPIFFHFPGYYKHMFPGCAEAAATHRRPLSPGKYFLDVDRQEKLHHSYIQCLSSAVAAIMKRSYYPDIGSGRFIRTKKDKYSSQSDVVIYVVLCGNKPLCEVSMSSRTLSAVLRSSSVASRAIALRGGHHHAPPPPPFARLPVPSGKPIALNRDLVWSDSVAPELVLDFDSPHISTSHAFCALVGTLALVPVFLGFLSWVDPDTHRKAAKRGNHLPDLRWEFGEIDEPEGEIEAL
ncbi:Aste57867_19548 [Aphanomyces stellatus]|uniref:Aste57867_19548 protein n=1 Tax=Aphanomyces stellatus TaxID=120398 RepID=A0A485LHG7_9STRA|nr:hypothetical protein As57867_019484 [Aphanomyces stellatus]VFT96254.1 Aste57867_19548 [Aphanomyces stellatus]